MVLPLIQESTRKKVLLSREYGNMLFPTVLPKPQTSFPYLVGKLQVPKEWYRTKLPPYYTL